MGGGWRVEREGWGERREEDREERKEGEDGEEKEERDRRTHFLRSCTTEVAVEESSPVVGSSR